MAKKSEDWLVSYGDCITLLICLLITIVVVLKGQSEDDIEWVADQVESISNIIENSYPDTNICTIKSRASSFKIILSGNNFMSCKDELNNDVIPIINSLGQDLIQYLHNLNIMEKPDFIEDSLYLEISIEGHTDSQPLPPKCGNFENNWQLSAARAYETMKVITDQRFIKNELKPYINSISVRGYADSHPICKKNIEYCHEKNRRTEIIFTAYLMGGSTYYKDLTDN